MQTATTSVYRRVPRVQFTYITKLTCPFCSLEWMSDLLLLPFLSGGQISPVQSRGTGDGSRLLPSTARRTEKPLRLSSEPLIAALSTVRPSSFAASSLPPSLLPRFGRIKYSLGKIVDYAATIAVAGAAASSSSSSSSLAQWKGEVSVCLSCSLTRSREGSPTPVLTRFHVSG